MTLRERKEKKVDGRRGNKKSVSDLQQEIDPNKGGEGESNTYQDGGRFHKLITFEYSVLQQ